MSLSITEAEVLSVIQHSRIEHPETREGIHVYTVTYATRDGRVGESAIYLSDEEALTPVIGRTFIL